MKTEVSVFGGFSKPIKATIVIDKNGMRVENKSEPYSGSKIIKGHLTQLIDIDQWNHSWHLNIDRAQLKGSDERKRVREILNEKIKQREDEIKKLKDGLQILSRWNIRDCYD